MHKIIDWLPTIKSFCIVGAQQNTVQESHMLVIACKLLPLKVKPQSKRCSPVASGKCIPQPSNVSSHSTATSKYFTNFQVYLFKKIVTL